VQAARAPQESPPYPVPDDHRATHGQGARLHQVLDNVAPSWMTQQTSPKIKNKKNKIINNAWPANSNY